MKTTIGILEVERRRRGLTATALAEQMGISRSALSQVERGAQRPSEPFKEKAAKALGLSVSKLWPEYWFLALVRPSGVSIWAAKGKTVVFTNKRRAARFASAAPHQLDVCGPAPPAFFALVHGLSEDQIPGELMVDPDPAAISIAFEKNLRGGG